MFYAVMDLEGVISHGYKREEEMCDLQIFCT